MKYSEKVHKAMSLASKMHQGQKRKGTDIPYIIHPLNVLDLAHEMGVVDENTLIACVLHDTIEDTPYTKEQLEKDFGEDVCQIVLDVSENKSLPTWKERKISYLEHLKSCDNTNSILVSTLDKIENLHNMYIDYLAIGDKLFDRFNADKNEEFWFYRSFVEIIKNKEIPDTFKEKLEKTLEKLENVQK